MTIAILSPIIGQWVQSEWNFVQELGEILQSGRDRYRSTAMEIDHVDIVISAQLQ